LRTASSCHPLRRLGTLTGGIRPPAAICTSGDRQGLVKPAAVQSSSNRGGAARCWSLGAWSWHR